MLVDERKLNKFVEKVVSDISEDETKIILPKGWQNIIITVRDNSSTFQYVVIWRYSAKFRIEEREHMMELIAEIACRPNFRRDGYEILELHVYDIEMVNEIIDSMLEG